MLQNSDGETEILLGNKQLLGLFVVMVCLLGIAFTGGYKIGQSSKKAVTASTTATGSEESPGSGTGTGGGMTQQLPGDSGSPSAAPSGSPDAGAQTETAAPPPATHSAADEDASRAMPKQAVDKSASSKAHAKLHQDDQRDLEAAAPPPRTTEVPVKEAANFAPQSGQLFLQVAAVTRDEAEGIAEVLRKKGFRAHAVPKPGSPRIYRVIIGPVRDASDLNNTRSMLRNNAGFREIIVQRY